jgi:hypothetical protein
MLQRMGDVVINKNTYVLEERSDTQHPKWHVSQLGNVVTVTALPSV